MDKSISEDLILDFADFKLTLIGIVISIIFFVVGKYIFKVSENSKYDLSLLAIAFIIFGFFCLIPLAVVVMKIGLWILLIGIVLYIGYRIINAND